MSIEETKLCRIDGKISKKKSAAFGTIWKIQSILPDRINMQLCHVVDRENIQIEIYERRGAGYICVRHGSLWRHLQHINSDWWETVCGGSYAGRRSACGIYERTTACVYDRTCGLYRKYYAGGKFFGLNWKISWCYEYRTAGNMGTYRHYKKVSCNCEAEYDSL